MNSQAIPSQAQSTPLCADPGNWAVPAYVAADFATGYVYERAQIAKAANKPFILEETGKAVSHLLA